MRFDTNWQPGLEQDLSSLEIRFGSDGSSLAAREPLSLTSRDRGLSPEIAVLLAAASPGLSVEFLKDQLRKLPPIDWSIVQQIAENQGLLLLAEPRLRGLPRSRPLTALLEASRKKYFPVLRKNLFLDNLTVQVAMLFSSAGISTLLFKGTPCMRQFYGDLGLKEVRDIDILVRREHVGRAREILKDIEFQEVAPASKFHEPRLQTRRTIAGTEYRINLHWSFEALRSGSLPIDEVWQTAIPYSESGIAEMRWKEWDHRLQRANVYAPSPEFQWLLCLHELALSGFDHWIHFADLCQISETYQRQLDWTLLASRIGTSGMKRIAYRGLAMVAAWGLSLPDQWSEQFRPALPRPNFSSPLRQIRGVQKKWREVNSQIARPLGSLSTDPQTPAAARGEQTGETPWRGIKSLLRSLEHSSKTNQLFRTNAPVIKPALS